MLFPNQSHIKNVSKDTLNGISDNLEVAEQSFLSMPEELVLRPSVPHQNLGTLMSLIQNGRVFAYNLFKSFCYFMLSLD
jgi:hypothetical protein